MSIAKFIIIHWSDIVLVLAAIAAGVKLLKNGEQKKLLRILLKHVTDAEKALGSGTGRLKLSTVSGWIYEEIPAIVRILFTDQEISDLVEKALTAAKQVWETNPDVKKYRGGEAGHA